MKLLDLTLPTPAQNLACDEALLDLCEEGRSDEILRFWEPREHFVVVGYANHVASEVNREECRRRNIPILRRCSGGGTVLQGPGCLNYAVVLSMDREGPLRSITSANRFIMERHCGAISALISQNRQLPETRFLKSEIKVRGHTDLAVNDLKFSGNAQRRRKRYLLFHGTFLLHEDLTLIEAILPMPTRQPVYRKSRSHREFLTNLGVPVAAVKKALANAWGAHEPLDHFPRRQTELLARDKYVSNEWNFRF